MAMVDGNETEKQMILVKHEPETKPRTAIEQWADRAVKHLAHHFRQSQVLVREYSKFIFESKAFKPQQVMDALGVHGGDIIKLLQAQGAMVNGMLGAEHCKALPDGWTATIADDGRVTLQQSPLLAQTPQPSDQNSAKNASEI
jgi:hypothetical protein